MNNSLVVIALLVALGAAGLAGYALSRVPADESDTELRLVAVEDQLMSVERDLGLLRDASRPPPSLMGLSPVASAPGEGAADGGTIAVADLDDARATGAAAREAGAEPGALAATEDAVRELVDKAVARKAAQMQAMREKKPSIDAFDEVLGLDEGQRASVEREVVKTQQEIRALLETPAEDGTVFLDELVDILASGIAQPGENKGRGMKLFGRLMTEKVPGTDETYAARAEGMKARLRASFRRDLSPKQYATFEAWQMDPSEIKNVPGSPWKDLEGRIVERAKDLGADLPDDGPR